MTQTGPSLQVTHYADAMFRGVLVGQGRGISMGRAKRDAALQALAKFKANEIPGL
ncbi:hypothetical protein BGW80DRAFT_1335040 [Lactifluus volemus]|nr:hypothetical protein BGW80DRAFT_1335040 [Lactifluus volemus]